MNDVKIVDIHTVIPYEKNPRKNDEAVKYVANSIKEFGFKVPIVVDKNLVVITGHTRLKAALSLGFTEVPIIVADDLTDEQVKAYRIADNKSAEKSYWDEFLLKDEIDELDGLFDFQDFGFEDWELGADDELFKDPNEEEDKLEDKYEPPKPEKLRCPHCGHADRVIRFEKVRE